MKSGVLIKQTLLDRGIKQSWLAKQLGINPSTLNSQLSRDLPSASLVKMCEILHISVETLFQQQKKDTEHPAKNASVSKSNNDT